MSKIKVGLRARRSRPGPPNLMAAKFSNPGWKSDVDAMPNADADFANYFCTYSFLYHQVPCSSHELATAIAGKGWR